MAAEVMRPPRKCCQPLHQQPFAVPTSDHHLSDLLAEHGDIPAQALEVVVVHAMLPHG